MLADIVESHTENLSSVWSLENTRALGRQFGLAPACLERLLLRNQQTSLSGFITVSKTATGWHQSQ